MPAIRTQSMPSRQSTGLSRSPHSVVGLSRNALVRQVMRLLVHVGSADALGVDRRRLGRFVEEASLLYRHNPYHNWHHAVDVTDTVAWLVTRTSLQKQLNPADVFWLMIAALVHDLDHPGHNNQWEISSKSPLAAAYRDSAVLENHSANLAFALLNRADCCFTDGMSDCDRKRGEFLLRELLLATDFAFHGTFIGLLRNVVEEYPCQYGFDQPQFTTIVLKALIKAADIGNVTKPFAQAVYWAERVMEEFWAQGDKEKAAGLPVGPLNDRDRVNLRVAQIGFIQHAALDLFALIARVAPELGILVGGLEENLANYQAPDVDEPVCVQAPELDSEECVRLPEVQHAE
jgi:hypothetical protein